MALVRLVSEVAGTVWKIEKAAGEPVVADETVLILESMKMEIPVVSEGAGTVREILVEEGASVGEGDEVAVVET